MAGTDLVWKKNTVGWLKKQPAEQSYAKLNRGRRLPASLNALQSIFDPLIKLIYACIVALEFWYILFTTFEKLNSNIMDIVKEESSNPICLHHVHGSCAILSLLGVWKNIKPTEDLDEPNWIVAFENHNSCPFQNMDP